MSIDWLQCVACIPLSFTRALYVVALPGVKERNARGYAVIHHGPQQLTAHSLLELLVTHRQVEPVDLLTAEPATNNKTAAESLPRSPDQTWYPTHDAANKARGTTTLKPRTKLSVVVTL